MCDKCECSARKALEFIKPHVKHREDVAEVCYDWCPACRIDAALAAPCPCGELREGGERLKEELRYEVRNAAWEAEQAQSATAERDQLRAENQRLQAKLIKTEAALEGFFRFVDNALEQEGH